MSKKLTTEQINLIYEYRPDVAAVRKSVEAVSDWWKNHGIAEMGADFFTNPGVSPAELQRQADAAKAAEIDAKTPDFMKNDPSWATLTNDQKEIAAYNYSIAKANDAAKAEALASALEQATAQADPYWKQIIRVAQDEVLRGFEEAQGDYTSSLERQQRRIAEIQQDLVSNKEFLTLTQQQSLASIMGDLNDAQQAYERNKQFYDAETAAQITRMDTDYQKQVEDITRNKEYLGAEEQSQLETLKKNYSINRGNVINQAENAGLTFSTKRDIAMERLKQENEGMVESTRRQFGNQIQALNSDMAYAEKIKQLTQGDVQRENVQRQAEILQGIQTAQRKSEESKASIEADYAKQIADLEVEASRGNTEAQAQIADLQRKLGESVTGIGRKAESYLGTENTPALEGYNPLGDITGTIYEEQKKDIEERKDAIYSELTAPSLQLTS